MNQKIDKISKKLKKKLDAGRYEHTLGVMYTAGAMAMAYGIDLESALLAGLLHDCAKCIPGREKIKICRKNGISVSKVELANPSLLHAKLGAFIAQTEYMIEDDDILNAIKSHTTGRPKMSTLEKIVYIADYIEPNRQPLPNMNEARYLAFHDLNECLYLILRDSVVYLKSKDMPIDEMTEKTFNYYKDKLGK